MGYDGALVLEFLARTHQTSLLTDREKHLIGLVVDIAVPASRGCSSGFGPCLVCIGGSLSVFRAGFGERVLGQCEAEGLAPTDVRVFRKARCGGGDREQPPAFFRAQADPVPDCIRDRFG